MGRSTHLLYPSLNVQPTPIPPYRAPPPLLPAPSSDTSFPILAMSILGILTTAVLLVGYYVFVIKCCLNWRRSDVISRLSDSHYSRRQRRLDDDPLATTGVRRGLEEALIRAIPVFRFEKDAGGGGGCEDGKAGVLNECAVCLNEFVEGDRLRRLPGCSHAFHIDCIDVWLQSSANCPLCRSDITGMAVLQRGQNLAQGAYHHRVVVVMDVREDGGDGAGGVIPRDETSQQRQQQWAPVVPAAQRQPSPRKAEQRTVQSRGQGRIHLVCSMGDECIDVRRGNDEQFCVQPMRRSFSVDSSCDRQLYLSVQEILQRDSRLHSQEIVGAGEGGSGSVPPAGRVRRSFFSFGRGSRSAAVLPMAVEP